MVIAILVVKFFELMTAALVPLITQAILQGKTPDFPAQPDSDFPSHAAKGSPNLATKHQTGRPLSLRVSAIKLLSTPSLQLTRDVSFCFPKKPPKILNRPRIAPPPPPPPPLNSSNSSLFIFSDHLHRPKVSLSLPLFLNTVLIWTCGMFRYATCHCMLPLGQVFVHTTSHST
uniref:Uncharacterized protein n=1 Tax=Kalanchoe fedtschenkoi TaxID=63787 RepID=A0A7N0T3S5_KALFE